jgi:hypothetical protein
MTARARPSINGLPWFADDAAIGQALLGPVRAAEWKQIATLLEGRGLPKIDPLMGGRYVPAVKAYFDREYKVGETSGAAPDGVEDLAAWKNPGQKRRA